MKLTNLEMVFLNSIAKGAEPFGLQFAISGEETAAADFMAKAVGQLQEKKLVGTNGKLSGLGAASIRLLEIYKTAREHIVINRMRICRAGKDELIVLSPTEEGYDMCCVQPAVVMFIMLKQCAFLRGAQSPDTPPFEPERMDIDEWAQRIGGFGKDYFYIGRYRDQRPFSEMMLYWNEYEGYQYDLTLQQEKRMLPRDMRMLLLEMLNADTGDFQ